MSDLLYTLLDLGDATSRNLDFAHKSNYQVSFGEETITETNLLELLRRHPDIVHVQTFSKAQEAQNGADWQWTILGQKLQFSMRVQAKRIQKNSSLRIKHPVGKAKNEQIDLLLQDAQQHGLDAFYCIYCSQKDRDLWNVGGMPSGGPRLAEYGCLMVEADKVKAKMPKKLSDIENDCFPWHYLVFDDALTVSYLEKTYAGAQRGMHLKYFSTIPPLMRGIFVSELEQPKRRSNLPTPDDLNGFRTRDLGREGLDAANPEEALRSRTDDEITSFRERGVSKRVVIDVRGFEPREDRRDD